MAVAGLYSTKVLGTGIIKYFSCGTGVVHDNLAVHLTRTKIRYCLRPEYSYILRTSVYK